MAIFDEELRALIEKVLKLGSMVEQAINDSIKSLVERDSAIAMNTIDDDHVVNMIDVEIDEECIRLIALRQPRARDLRLITTAMKITTDLERIGDLAVDVCERALELNEEPQLKPYIDIPRMAEIAQKMVKDALDAFVKRDYALARDVLTRDDMKVEWLCQDWGLGLGRRVEQFSGHQHPDVRARQLDIQVVEMPRLYPLSSENARAVRKAVKTFDAHLHVARRAHLGRPRLAHNVLMHLIRSYEEADPDEKDPIHQYLTFISNYGEENCTYDIALRNFMQTRAGEIVLLDPAVSRDVLDIIHNVGR